jgi:hypothetical protein
MPFYELTLLTRYGIESLHLFNFDVLNITGYQWICYYFFHFNVAKERSLLCLAN